jgi:SOS-response transcriptional repressor LexA
MTLKQKLKKLLDERGRGTKAKLAKFLNVSPNYITRYVEEEYKDVDMPSKYFVKTALFFGISPEYFLSNSESSFKPVKKIPIVGSVSCGKNMPNSYQGSGEFAYYNGEFYSPELYCVIACGDSMSPEIEDGDEVICDPKVEVQNGDMVHYTIGNESAIKIYVRNDDANIIQFVPYNQSEDFKTKIIRLDDEMAAEVKINKVIAVNKLKFNNRKARLKLINMT